MRYSVDVRTNSVLALISAPDEELADAAARSVAHEFISDYAERASPETPAKTEVLVELHLPVDFCEGSCGC